MGDHKKAHPPDATALTDIQRRALQLYQAPFKYDKIGGYIWDARNEMVADDHGASLAEVISVDYKASLVRVRGWGRIGYLEEPHALQDAVGELIAAAMTEFWRARQ